jgi:hypothetical protein
MRKLSELLPIARKFLVTAENPFENSMRDCFTCYAAEKAWRSGEMTMGEQIALRDAIEDELSRQRYGASTICRIASYAGVEYRHLNESAYIYFRDSWLDDFQSKLEADEAMFITDPVLV